MPCARASADTSIVMNFPPDRGGCRLAGDPSDVAASAPLSPRGASPATVLNHHLECFVVSTQAKRIVPAYLITQVPEEVRL